MIFTHGNNINFQQSACEMSPADLDQLINHYLDEANQLLVGTIHLDKLEIHRFGIVQSIQVTAEQFTCSFLPSLSSQPQQIIHMLEDLVISHEAHFDVIDQHEQTIRYKVAYVTFMDIETGEEITYFFADCTRVENPLTYIAAFWEQVSEVGRDVDFSLTGCQANDFAKKLAESNQSHK